MHICSQVVIWRSSQEAKCWSTKLLWAGQVFYNYFHIPPNNPKYFKYLCNYAKIITEIKSTILLLSTNNILTYKTNCSARKVRKVFLQFCSILEWDDAGPALEVFYGVSNDEFAISLAVILTVLKRRKTIKKLSKWQAMRLRIRHLKRHQKLRARVQHRPIQVLNKIAKIFSYFSRTTNLFCTLKDC
jgi:hypothetical protein